MFYGSPKSGARRRYTILHLRCFDALLHIDRTATLVETFASDDIRDQMNKHVDRCLSQGVLYFLELLNCRSFLTVVPAAATFLIFPAESDESPR